MSNMFIVLLPMMLPIAKAALPLMQEKMLIIISGNDVPKATIVNPIMSGDSFALMPTLVAPFTSQLAPKIRATKPRISREYVRIESMFFCFSRQKYKKNGNWVVSLQTICLWLE